MSGLTRDSRQKKKARCLESKRSFFVRIIPHPFKEMRIFFSFSLVFFRLIQRLTTWFLRASSSCFQLYPSCTAVTQLELEMLETTFFQSKTLYIENKREENLLHFAATSACFCPQWFLLENVFLFFVFIWWPFCGKNVLFEKLVIFPGTFSLKLYGRLWT